MSACFGLSQGDDLESEYLNCTAVLARWCSLSKKLLSILYIYKGSAWVPAFAGTHAPGRAGQHFELFDSILGRVKKSHHTQSQSARTVWKVMPRVR